MPDAQAAPRPATPRTRATGTRQYRLVEAETPEARAELEAFIAERYEHAYGARIHSFMPRLYALVGDDGRPLAAFGLRDAASEPLFLETYLEQPIEQTIGERRSVALSRHEIVEVGNLAGRHGGALRVLILQLGILLQNMGYRWLVFTGHKQLINGFARLDVELVEFAAARIECIPQPLRSDWGRYYDDGPVVIGADISAGRAHLLAHPELLRRALPPTISGDAA
ncbi:hypothetical protein G7Y82_10875 [Solimonas sp. C16B3]|uniref:Thermostable hemolysin n=2 Tax=Solimonas marina TaxID=2714601 RepID=A0A970B9Y2_9GAMM|nr:hypothetical protein [Solimonas marina]